MAFLSQCTRQRLLQHCRRSLVRLRGNLDTNRTISSAGPTYDCGIDAETVERYCPDGYHPVNIDDTFHSGRYRVVQKLGWGGNSTVWLVHDSILSRLAALKIVVSEIKTSNEVRILQRLASLTARHDGQRHLRQLTDYFFHDGPNGRHQCLVFDVGGISAHMIADEYAYTRLPGRLAWQISKQITLALDCLHSEGIAHGDIHTGNILVSQSETQFSDLGLLDRLDPPELADIIMTNRAPRNNSSPRTYNFPRRMVGPALLPLPTANGQVHARLIDFEQAFHCSDTSLAPICAPLVLRAPETLLDSTWDLQMDIWSLACTIFQLVTGRIPFDVFFGSKASLVSKWISLFGDVPDEWREQAKVVVGDCQHKIDASSISSWLRDTYFADEKKTEFMEEDIKRLGDLLSKMMCYRPKDRLAVSDVLKHDWFLKNPLAGENED